MAQDEPALYEQILNGLREEVRLLRSICDEASAQAAAAPLAQVVHRLAALNDGADENALWRYIDNTPNLKKPLIEEIEQLFVHLQRLENAQFYRHAALEELLRPMITPAS